MTKQIINLKCPVPNEQNLRESLYNTGLGSTVSSGFGTTKITGFKSWLLHPLAGQDTYSLNLPNMTYTSQDCHRN